MDGGDEDDDDDDDFVQPPRRRTRPRGTGEIVRSLLGSRSLEEAAHGRSRSASFG